MRVYTADPVCTDCFMRSVGAEAHYPPLRQPPHVAFEDLLARCDRCGRWTSSGISAPTKESS